MLSFKVCLISLGVLTLSAPLVFELAYLLKDDKQIETSRVQTHHQMDEVALKMQESFWEDEVHSNP